MLFLVGSEIESNSSEDENEAVYYDKQVRPNDYWQTFAVMINP